MANSYHGDQNGMVPHFDQQAYPQASPDVLQRQNGSKPFTLNEALPYTPFTSVFPFEPGESAPKVAPSFSILVVFCAHKFQSFLRVT